MGENSFDARGGLVTVQTAMAYVFGIGIVAVGLVRLGYEIGTRHARRAMREIRAERKELEKEKKQFYRDVNKTTRKRWFFLK